MSQKPRTVDQSVARIVADSPAARPDYVDVLDLQYGPFDWEHGPDGWHAAIDAFIDAEIAEDVKDKGLTSMEAARELEAADVASIKAALPPNLQDTLDRCLNRMQTLTWVREEVAFRVGVAFRGVL